MPLSASPICSPPTVQPDGQLDGLILTHTPSDGVRALRPDVATTYYIAFDGSNMTDGGAPSPDGRYYAVPHGYIQANTSADVRYVVQEIRVITTERVPRLIARVPWRASFSVGTPFAPAQGIARIAWVDAATLTFPSGSVDEVQTWHHIQPFQSNMDHSPFVAGGWQPLSPDGLRGIRSDARGYAVYDVRSGQAVGALPRLSASPQIAWSPDSARIAAVTHTADGLSLALFWRGGAYASTVFVAEYGTSIANVRWSPDSTTLAFTVFDPQTRENRLYLYQVNGGALMSACLDLLNLPDVLAWSASGDRLAVLMGRPDAVGLYAYTPADARLEWLADMRGGALLGWYDLPTDGG